MIDILLKQGVRKVEDFLDLKINFYDDHLIQKIKNVHDLNIYIQNNKEFLLLERSYKSNYQTLDYQNDEYDCYVLDIGNSCGDSFIVDFNGIDNFITAKDLVFNDYDVREIIFKHINLESESYVRFGVSGSRPSTGHPGGEVLECQNINVENKTGVAKSISGYLGKYSNQYSVAVPLSEDGKTLKEERTVYSHTIWIPENTTPIVVKLTSKCNGMSLLSAIYDVCKSMDLNACGIKMQLKNGEDVRIKGRVLKHIPASAFKILQEATDIAVEKEFVLPRDTILTMLGTLYNRFEPEWTEFTDGRIYEKRGHYHASITGNCLEQVHEVFHVRDIYLNMGAHVEIQIYPSDYAYRIIPISKKDNEYVTSSFEKNVKKYVEDYNKYDYYL